jgi:hypothetical protein
MKIDYDGIGAGGALNMTHVTAQLQAQLDSIPRPTAALNATHVLITGLLHHTVCFTTLQNTLVLLQEYMRLLQQWQQQRGSAVVIWRTAESFGDFKEHSFLLENGGKYVMRGRPTHLNPRCTRRRVEIANEWSRNLAAEHGLRLMDAAQAPHTSHLTPHTSHLTPHTSHLTPHTSHLTPHTSHLTPHTSRLAIRC